MILKVRQSHGRNQTCMRDRFLIDFKCVWDRQSIRYRLQNQLRKNAKKDSSEMAKGAPTRVSSTRRRTASFEAWEKGIGRIVNPSQKGLQQTTYCHSKTPQPRGLVGLKDET